MSEQPQSLQSMMPGTPKRRGWMLPAALGVPLLVLAGGAVYWLAVGSPGSPTPVQTTPAAAPTTPATVGKGTGTDPVAIQVCLELTIEDASDMAKMRALGEKAATSGDQMIKLSGMILRDEATLAEMDGGKGANAVKVVGDLADLMSACLDGGYQVKR